MNGEPDGAPIVPAFPLADMTSALYAVNAVMFALYHRDVHGGGGQVIDVSLFESLFSLLGPLPAEYAALGRLRERNGSRSKNAGPRGCYRTARRPLHRGQRLDAEDGRAVPARLRARRSARAIRASPPTRRASQHAAELDDAGRRRPSPSRTLDENLRIIDAQRSSPPCRCRRSPTSSAIRTGSARELTARRAQRRRHRCACTTSCRGCRRRPGEIRRAGGALGQDNARRLRRELGLSCDDLDSAARRRRHLSDSPWLHLAAPDAALASRPPADRRRLGRGRRAVRRSSTSSPARSIGHADRASREQVDAAVAAAHALVRARRGSTPATATDPARRAGDLIERRRDELVRAHHRRGRLPGRPTRSNEVTRADPDVPDLGRGRQAAGRRNGADRGGAGQRAPHGVHHPRAARRGLRHHLVQLAAQHGRAQGGAGAGRGQHGRASSRRRRRRSAPRCCARSCSRPACRRRTSTSCRGRAARSAAGWSRTSDIRFYHLHRQHRASASSCSATSGCGRSRSSSAASPRPSSATTPISIARRRACVNSAFRRAGQVCTSTQRLFVAAPRSLDAFLDEARRRGAPR